MYVRRDIKTNSHYSIQKLLRNISEMQRLTDEEEFALAHEYQTASEERKREIESALLCSNMRFVVTMAKQYQLDRYDLDDLIMCGAYGLLTAIRRFDPTRGIKLLSYAVHRIRREIFEYVRCEYTKYSPSSHFKYIKQIAKEYDNIVQPNGQLSPDAIQRYFNMPLEEAIVAYHAYMARYAYSVNENTADESLRPDQQTITSDIVDRVRECVDKLDELERLLVCAQFQIGGAQYLSLRAFAEEHGLTTNRVRAIYSRALRKLRQMLKDENNAV